jgi:hypothetical protein
MVAAIVLAIASKLLVLLLALDAGSAPSGPPHAISRTYGVMGT